jgi:hypothetical protein
LKTLVKIKMLYLILLLPLILATTCEDDDINSGFETEYVLENDSSIDLILCSEGGRQTAIPSQSEISIGRDFNPTTNAIDPSESFVFGTIKLYKMDNNDFLLVYKQNPIQVNLWTFNEPTENRFEYRLTITDELLE